MKYTAKDHEESAVCLDAHGLHIHAAMAREAAALLREQAKTTGQGSVKVEGDKLVTDREALHSSDEYRRQVAAAGKLREIREQAKGAQPVAWRYKLASGEWRYATKGEEISIPQPIIDTQQLYTAPRAAMPGERTPETWHESEASKAADEAYCAGWNACRAEMLLATPRSALPQEATPEMEKTAEAYWKARRFAGLSNNPRTWAGVYAAMLSAAPSDGVDQGERHE